MNGGFLVTKIKQLGDRIFEKILSEKNIDAFNGAQGRILYVLWQEDGISIRSLSIKCGLAITSLTTMLERMEKQGLISRVQSETDKRKTLLFLTEKAHALKGEYDSVSDEMGSIYYKGFSEEEITRFEECLDRIKNQVVMNMFFVYMGGKHKLILAAQDFFCKLHADLMGLLRRDLPRLKGLDQVAAQVRSLVDGVAAGPGKFDIRGFGGAAMGGYKQLSIRLFWVADIVNGRFQR